jgi:hypothetical protein
LAFRGDLNFVGVLVLIRAENVSPFEFLDFRLLADDLAFLCVGKNLA